MSGATIAVRAERPLGNQAGPSTPRKARNVQPLIVMAILHDQFLPALAPADPTDDPRRTCSIARESVVLARHLCAMTAELCRKSHRLRADLDRLRAQCRITRGPFDPPSSLAHSAVTPTNGYQQAVNVSAHYHRADARPCRD